MSSDVNFRDLQVLEQQFQSVLMQKQSIQLESMEFSNALNEVQKTNGDVYRIVGSAMVLADKKDVEADLQKKLSESKMKLDALEKQEKQLENSISTMQKEIQQRLSKDKN